MDIGTISTKASGQPPSVRRPVSSRSRRDAAQRQSLDSMIDSARDAFLLKKEERRVRELYERVCSLKHVPVGVMIGSDMVEMLEGMHISRNVLPNSLMQYEILFKNQCVVGVGYMNQNGGLSFYSPKIRDIANIGEEGVTLLYSKENQRNSSICIFENFLDYLAYRTLMSFGRIKDVPCCDIIIMNSIRNFIHCMFECENYDRVLCFFRCDGECSPAMRETFIRRMTGTSKDMSYIYSGSGCNSILEFIQEL